MVILRDHINGETPEWLDVDDIQFDDDNNSEHERPARDDVVPLIGSILERTNTDWPCHLQNQSAPPPHSGGLPVG